MHSARWHLFLWWCAHSGMQIAGRIVLIRGRVRVCRRRHLPERGRDFATEQYQRYTCTPQVHTKPLVFSASTSWSPFECQAPGYWCASPLVRAGGVDRASPQRSCDTCILLYLVVLRFLKSGFPTYSSSTWCQVSSQ